MEAITINPNRIDLDEAYLQMAEVWARRSKANRLQVGALIVKDKQIISDGYNGMPAGSADDTCETWYYDPNDERSPGGSTTPTMVTKREVLHAESNALMKIAENGGTGAQGATLYTTWSPCFECAKLIRQAKIKRVVFRNAYRDMDGVQFLIESGVPVVQLHGDETLKSPPPPPRAPAPRAPSLIQQVAAPVAVAPPVEPPPLIHAEPTPEQRLNSFQAPQEDEVAALLRAHEASLRQAAAPAAADAPPTGKPEAPAAPYVSSFL